MKSVVSIAVLWISFVGALSVNSQTTGPTQCSDFNTRSTAANRVQPADTAEHSSGLHSWGITPVLHVPIRMEFRQIATRNAPLRLSARHHLIQLAVSSASKLAPSAQLDLTRLAEAGHQLITKHLALVLAAPERLREPR